MLKKPFNLKFVAIGLTAVAAFSLSSLALADDTSADTSATATASSADPFADQSTMASSATPVSSKDAGIFKRGFYAGAQADYGFNTWKAADTDLSKAFLISGIVNTDNVKSANYHIKSRGIGGRAFLGYDINNLFGIEIGGFINPSIDASLTDIVAQNGKTLPAEHDLSKTTSYGADIVGKVHMTFGHSLFGFAGAGMAWTHYKQGAIAKDADGNTQVIKTAMPETTWNHFAPEVLGGIGYAVSDNMAVTAQYSYVFGKKPGDVTLADFNGNLKDGYKPKFGYSFSKISLGLTYKF